jgi:hypothetical protein
VRREAMNGALGMGNDCRMWCARRIGLVVRDVRLPRGMSQRAGRRRRRRRLLASNAAGAAGDAGLRVVFLSGGRRPRVDGAEDVAASAEVASGKPRGGLAMASAGHAGGSAGGSLRSGGDAPRRKRREVRAGSAEDSRGVPRGDERNSDDRERQQQVLRARRVRAAREWWCK